MDTENLRSFLEVAAHGSFTAAASRLNLAQSYYFLKDQEVRAGRIVDKEFIKISEWYRRIETSTAERRAYAEAVDARFKIFLAGSSRSRTSSSSTRR